LPGAPVERGTTRKRYTPEEKRALVAEYESSDAKMVDFCAQRGVSTPSLCTWRKRLRIEGDRGLAARPNARNVSGPHRGAFSYTPEQRRAAVEAFQKAGETITDFARVWGVSRVVLSRWLKRYREDGPKALEPKRRTRSARAGTTSRVGKRIAQPIRDLIARTKERFPTFGLLKVRQFLLRFHAVKVSTGGVKRVLRDAGVLAAPPPERKVRRAPPAVQSFERAKPMELWQTDITSFVLGRHRERAYLTVFLDDCSRYVVSFALHLQQKSELVIEALKDGIARFGKPREILTDQGRQYFAWRGKSELQKLLRLEGIQHVVARSHHPQTVGKCERLWETVKRELLDRVELKDVTDGRLRLAHYFAHYNFFRPHQGIDGLVPADRFFSVQDALRKALEAQLVKNELALALGEAPPPRLFFFGQIGEQQVVMHGERGRVVIQTSGGESRELLADEIELNGARLVAPELATGTPVKEAEETHEPGSNDVRSERGQLDGKAAATHAPVAQATPVEGAAHAATREGAVGCSERRGKGASASHGGGDAAGLARQNEAGGSGDAAATDAAARVAAEPAGRRGDGRGTLEAAARSPEGSRADGGESRRGPEVAEAEDHGARAQAQDRGGRDRALAGDAGAGQAPRGEGEDAGGERGAGGTHRESGGEIGGGDAERPGAREEAPRDAQIDSPKQHGSG
jgi:transposase InsO family protein